MAGKKRGSNRQQKRSKAAAESLLDTNLNANNLTDVPDADLFTIDTAPSKKRARTSKSGSTATTDLGKSKKQLSDKKARQVTKLIKLHGDKVVTMAEDGKKKTTKTKSPVFDIWASSPTTAPTRKKKSIDGKKTLPPTISLDVPKAGQSYNPDHNQHQDVLGEALSLEIRRKDAKEDLAKPINSAMADFMKKTVTSTNEFYVDDASESDSSSSEEDGDDDSAPAPKLTRRKEKKTKAQRNKQKRARKNEADITRRKNEKKFLHTVHESKKIKKEVVKELKEKAERKQEIDKLVKERKMAPKGVEVEAKFAEKNPIKADSIAVALTDEIKRNGGGLRTIVRKGDLLKDRVLSMKARGLVEGKSERKKKIVQGKRRRGAKASEQYQLW